MSEYVIRQARDGSWFYIVRSATNHKTLSTSEMYPTKAHAERGIEDAKAEAKKE